MEARPLLLWILLFLPPGCVLAADGAGDRGNRPHVVLILADDLGYGDLGCYNPERGRIPTPHLDRLAGEGMRFTDAHSSSGVCSPSRYTFLTGRYHWRTRLQAGIVGLWDPPLILPDRLTIASLARREGYRTACVGKWHLGWDWPISAAERPYLTGLGGYGRSLVAEATPAHREAWREVFTRRIPGGPVARGFEHYFGTDVPNWPPYCFLEDDRAVGVPTGLLPLEKLRNNQASLQGPALEGWQLESILPALADRACAFIAEAARKPQPFLLYLPLTSPHTPLAINPDWQGRSGLNAYADFVMETDAMVGRVLKALDTAGIAGRTLVVFTSDNGCAHYIGVPELEANGHHPSGPWRGYKADAWEGGHRVPFLVRWPGQVRPGTICDHLVHQADLFATFADLLGVSFPDDAGEDSFSLVSLLRGEDRAIRTHAVSCSAKGVPALREGEWKVIFGSGDGGLAGGSDANVVQLFNLTRDPGETENLAEADPERVARMTAQLEELIRDGRSTPGLPQTNDVEVRRFPR